jgi:putative phosphonate metabolism protein
MSGPAESAAAARRYAVYFTPPVTSDLWRFASQWLGRDAISGAAVPPPTLRYHSPEALRRVTDGARHYGFHATLKAPFRLATGRSRSDVIRAVAQLARGVRAFTPPPLRVAVLDRFLALVPSDASPDLQGLADACVQNLDFLRAALTEDEIAKRRRAALTPRQDALMLRWGYPYVFEEFRFHMTLTDALPDTALEAARLELGEFLAPIVHEPLRIDAVAIFEQLGDQAFRLTERFELAA